MDLHSIIFFGIIAIMIIVLISYIISKSKGKIEIILNKFEFSPGEKIKGVINLKIQKPVSAKELNVELIGILNSKNYSAKGTSSNSKMVYNFKKPIAGEGEYSVGERTINFDLSTPKNIVTNKIINSVPFQILSGQSSQIEWFVIANLEIPGFNISKKVKINII